MSCEQMMHRMSFVLRAEYLEKTDISINSEGIMIIRIDLHGMTKKEALKLINGILLLNTGYFILDIIHGYSHGTALKSMIYEELDSNRIRNKWGYAHNYGETFLEISSSY